jgi:hypothetical protein
MVSDSELMSAAQLAVGGSGLVSLVFFTIRHFVLKVSKDFTTVQGDMTQRELVGGLREEVARLEAVVDKMQKSIESHTGKIAVLERQVMDYRGSAMVALALVESFQCDCDNGMRERLVAILHRMAKVEDLQQ